MKNRTPALLSHLPIVEADLRRLLDLARQDRALFFERHTDWGVHYADRLLGTALCQGAALHFLDPCAGINDFDVYTFYADNPERKWYAKRIKCADFGDPKFGRSEVGPRDFTGRRVDLLARSLPVAPATELVSALRAWLSAGQTATARELAKKAVVVLEPLEQLGAIAWRGAA